jgi:hypothetical protein
VSFQQDCGLWIADCGLTAERPRRADVLLFNPQSTIHNPQSASAIRNPQSKWRLSALLALIGLTAMAAAGCQPFAYLLVQTIGPFVPEDEVQAEYELKGRSVLVLVDTKDPSLASENPRLQASLSDAIGKTIAEKKGCGPVVPGHSIESARRAEVKFGDWSVAQVGKYFNVDFVVHVEVMEFRLRDNAASNVYHGYAEAAVRIVNPDTGEQVWPVLSPARLITAETQPGVEAERPTEQENILVEGLGQKIARQFYTYKKDDLPMRPKVK